MGFKLTARYSEKAQYHIQAQNKYFISFLTQPHESKRQSL